MTEGRTRATRPVLLQIPVQHPVFLRPQPGTSPEAWSQVQQGRVPVRPLRDRVHKPTLTRREHERLINLRAFEDTVDPSYGARARRLRPRRDSDAALGEEGQSRSDPWVYASFHETPQSRMTSSDHSDSRRVGETAKSTSPDAPEVLQQRRTPHQQRQPLRPARRQPPRPRITDQTAAASSSWAAPPVCAPPRW